MSYNGIGLSSAKGSSTSGYVQQSLATAERRKESRSKELAKTKQVATQDAGIKLHKTKRQIELLVSEYRDALEDDPADLSDDVIDAKCEEYRKQLLHKDEET